MTQYILTVTAAAMLAAILRCIAGQGSMGKLVGLLAGVFMALTIISPLMRLELPDPVRWFSAYTSDGSAAAATGENMAREVSNAIITEELEAYIGDKATLCRADLAVEVTVTETGMPESVILTGAVSPYAKDRLSHLIETELGVGEEAQQWIS